MKTAPLISTVSLTLALLRLLQGYAPQPGWTPANLCALFFPNHLENRCQEMKHPAELSDGQPRAEELDGVRGVCVSVLGSRCVCVSVLGSRCVRVSPRFFANRLARINWGVSKTKFSIN